MYIAIRNKDGSLKHSYECTAAFGRKDTECPRCQELLAGAAPRAGWQKEYYELKALNDKIAALPHKCTSHCFPVCTHNDY